MARNVRHNLSSVMKWQDEILAMRRKLADGDEGDEDEVMVIGIDFGTTFSGAAWATAADLKSDQINLITAWPGNGLEDAKAPTELFYEDDKVMWGYEIPPDADPVRWFKLLLLKEEDLHKDLRLSEFIVRGRRMLRENNKTAIDFIADYLRLLWGHIIESISKARGESVVDAMTLHVVITVPAIWKNYAHQDMEKAAKQAGILDRRPAGPTTLSFAPEPEAAAMSTLCEPGRMPRTGEVYVVCDAGGGTVDLISYEIERANPVAMKEAVEGTGGLCGGIFIDEAFEAMCKARLGRKWDHLSKAGIKEIMKGDWERAIKAQFKSGNANKEYIVRIPAEAVGKGSSILDDTTKRPFIKNGRIHFSSDDIQKTFTKAFEEINKLINGQVHKAKANGSSVAAIILVGGLGGSPYLYEYLKQKHTKTNVAVLQSGGMKPRAAICRGAVIKGFLNSGSRESKALGNNIPVSVTSTISRANIGVIYRPAYDAGKHDIKDKVWDADEGVWRADNQMQWFIKRIIYKGDNVAADEPVRNPFFRLCTEETYTGFVESHLYYCEHEVAPTRYKPTLTDLGRLVCKIDIPYSLLENFTSVATGEAMKRLDYEFELKPSGASVKFAAIIDGKRLGSKDFTISFK